MAAKTGITYETIVADIRRKEFSPVYFLMGEEAYFIDKITDLLLSSVLEDDQKEFDLSLFYAKDTTIENVLTTAKRYPMFSTFHLVVVKEAQLFKEKDFEWLEYYMKQPPGHTILVINYKYGNVDRRKKWISMVDKQGVVFSSQKLYDSQIPKWIAQYLKENKITAEEKVIDLLSEFLGNDLSRVSHEIDKLIMILSSSSQKTITAEMVEKNIGISKDFNSFELLKALAERNTTKAYLIMNYLSKNGNTTEQYFSMLSVLFNYFSNLAVATVLPNKSDDNLNRTLALRNYYQLQDYKAGLKNYSWQKVFYIISALRVYDAKGKGFENSSASHAELMKELIYFILH